MGKELCGAECLKNEDCTAIHYYEDGDEANGDCYLHKGTNVEAKKKSDGRMRVAGIKVCRVPKTATFIDNQGTEFKDIKSFPAFYNSKPVYVFETTESDIKYYKMVAVDSRGHWIATAHTEVAKTEDLSPSSRWAGATKNS